MNLVSVHDIAHEAKTPTTTVQKRLLRARVKPDAYYKGRVFYNSAWMPQLLSIARRKMERPSRVSIAANEVLLPLSTLSKTFEFASPQSFARFLSTEGIQVLADGQAQFIRLAELDAYFDLQIDAQRPPLDVRGRKNRSK